MLNSGEKKLALCATKKNILTCVVRKKNHNPPLQVKWLVPYVCLREKTLSFNNNYIV